MENQRILWNKTRDFAGKQLHAGAPPQTPGAPKVEKQGFGGSTEMTFKMLFLQITKISRVFAMLIV